MRLTGPSLKALAMLLLAGKSVLFTQAAAAPSQQTFGNNRVGVAYRIMREIVTAEKDNKGSTGNSTDRDTLVERVLDFRRDGVELEYDLPADTTAQVRETEWQFPLRIFKPSSGSPQVLNRAELEGRVESWLKRSGLNRDACGEWVFTWNAVKIECDPQSTLKTVAAFDLTAGAIRDGGTYNDPQASGPITLRKTSEDASGAAFTGNAAIDPERVRREQAQADVVVAEIVKRPLTLDEALQARSREKVSGHIDVTFDTNPDGSAWRRTTTTTLQTTDANGVVDKKTIMDTVTRRIISGETQP